MQIAGWIRLSIGGGAALLIGMGLGRFSYTPLVPALVENGGLTAAQAGYVGAFNLLGYLVGALAALRVGRALGEVRTLKLCLVLSLACLAASIPDFGFIWLAFWRFLVGVAVGMIMICALAIVTRHAPPDRLGRATGICFTGVGIAILLSGTLIPILLNISLMAAWTGIATLGSVAVLIGFWGLSGIPALPADLTRNRSSEKPGRPPITRAVICLIGGQTMFSLGLVPHTIYWVDYIVRGLGRDIGVGGLHWVLFGLGAVSGTYLWGRRDGAGGDHLAGAGQREQPVTYGSQRRVRSLRKCTRSKFFCPVSIFIANSSHSQYSLFTVLFRRFPIRESPQN